MSKIEVGSIVEFKGFKQQEAIDTATVEELEQMYPLMKAGCWFEVKSVGRDGIVRLMAAGEFDSSIPTFLFENEVELVG